MSSNEDQLLVDQNFSDLTVMKLRRELRNRGLKVFGRKMELVSDFVLSLNIRIRQISI